LYFALAMSTANGLVEATLGRLPSTKNKVQRSLRQVICLLTV